VSRPRKVYQVNIWQERSLVGGRRAEFVVGSHAAALAACKAAKAAIGITPQDIEYGDADIEIVPIIVYDDPNEALAENTWPFEELAGVTV
jgi:hypothetical protein